MRQSLQPRRGRRAPRPGNFFKVLPLAFAALILFLPFHAGAFPEPRKVVIEIENFEFVSSGDNVLRPGDTVVWINRDLAPHTATAKDKSWDSGPLEKDQSWQMTVGAETTLGYFCRFHPTMEGVLEIKK